MNFQVGCECPKGKSDGPEYYCQDMRLGPAMLPATPALAPLLTHYTHLGGICPSKWLEVYTLSTGKYDYPPSDGFQLSTANVPIKGEELLPRGTRLDRFGDSRGRFLSPAYTPVEQRALPPSRLNPTGDPPAVEYHVYEVVTENLSKYM
jgi:hypothetical protein